MNGLRTRQALAHLRMMSQLPVRTIERKERVRERNVNYIASKEGGKLARKRSGL